MDQEQNSPFQYLPLGVIVPSKTNKRRIRQDKLQELAENIKANGVMQPILVRPIGKDGRAMFNAGHDVEPHHYEIVAGERRWRASQLADQVSIPAMVRELIDLTALQLQVFENLHRDNLHPMEEAEAFDQLLKKSQDLIGLSVDELALKVNKSRSYIYASLKLLELCTYARDAFFDEKIGKETAVLIARIPGEQLQTQAIKEIIKPNFNGDSMSFRAAKAYIHQRYTLNLENAPWDTHSTTLCPDAGSCFSCPKRSGNYPELYADIESPDVCTDPDCFAAKKAAHVEILKVTAGKVICGDEAKEIAPYGAQRYISGGYKTIDGYISTNGVSGTVKDLLGEDLPEPSLLIDHNNDTIEVFEESALKQKLQEKIAAGELQLTPSEPSKWEIERAARQAKQATEEKRRERVFLALFAAIRDDQISIDQEKNILRLATAFLFEQHVDHDADGVICNAYGHNPETGEFIDQFMQQPQSFESVLKLLALALAAPAIKTGYSWESPEDNEEDDEYKQFAIIAREFGVDPDGYSGDEEPASPPPSAAQASEILAEPGLADAPDGAGQASETPEPAAQAGEDLPPAFAEIKAKALAKKARKENKKGSADADADSIASAAAATEETTEVAA